jgi:uroporphyrin-III C-methyltransferase
MVYLTGAGPGAKDLLTIKALRVIQQADVIIYDRLANPEILEEAKDGCEFIYVGKADSHHTLPQEESNEVI